MKEKIIILAGGILSAFAFVVSLGFVEVEIDGNRNDPSDAGVIYIGIFK